MPSVGVPPPVVIRINEIAANEEPTLRTGTRTEGRTHGGQHHEGTSPPWLPQLDQSWPAQEVGSVAVPPRLTTMTSIAVRAFPVSRCEIRIFGVLLHFSPVSTRGRHGPDAPPLAPASARSRTAPRARRASGARHGIAKVTRLCCARERTAPIVRSRPQRQARCASRSVRPLRASTVGALILPVASEPCRRRRTDGECTA